MSSPGADRVLGTRYRLIREIARGGMAVVWEAQDILLDRHVALKLLHPQYADDPEFLERFRREARAAARLSQPNIVSIYDVGEDADTHTPFIVMELVEGGNLKDLIRRSAPLADDRIRSIGAALAVALDYAHGRGLIHRDVKPQNVLLGEDGRPRLTDFGIAQAAASSGLTRTGAVMGSVHYLAPELVRGRPATAQSDIYGLGAVLYEMATGRVPFEGDTDLAIALAHVEQAPVAPRSINPRLAPDLERTIMRSLAKSPEQRFRDAGEMAAELRRPRPPAVPVPPVAPRPNGATQRMPTVPAAPVARPPTPRRAVAVAEAPARRTARPRTGRGAGGGVLALLLAMAAVLVALGAGFFGLATLNRGGSPFDPNPAPTARPTAGTNPAGVATPTVRPAPSVTPVATPVAEATLAPTPSPLPTTTPVPTPSPAPTPSPVPPSPTPPKPTPTPRSVPIPQLRGKSLDDALAAVEAAGLTATVRGVNANVDKDIVVDESPDVAATLPPGGTISIVVGTGFTAIPAVASLPKAQAIRLLAANSFQVTERDRHHPSVPPGLAIDTTPGAGTVAPRNANVDLGISLGR